MIAVHPFTFQFFHYLIVSLYRGLGKDHWNGEERPVHRLRQRKAWPKVKPGQSKKTVSKYKMFN